MFKLSTSSNMNITIQNVNNSHLTDDLKAFIIKKLKKLITYSQEIQDADVFLLESPHNDRKDKGLECKLYLAGYTIFAKSFETSFEKATDSVTESLRRQIQKMKTKRGY